ncbi:tetratricopeptide repeat protein [Streptomyces halstedii]|uniref:Tetratricopeptide repeat protein n=1 Tax=Streptomyces halstedii TaxID=1944 RepID=A0ABS6U0L9_STRHA|nr:tetratricopeptide repeat protein [Streptomyces halstedii]MBV7674092.1 tetratricopeptide repeat protein [Streptomyces halstedii]
MHTHEELGLESPVAYQAELRRLSAEADRAATPEAAAAALLATGRVNEKLGKFVLAFAQAREARTVFRDAAAEPAGVAECAHTMAVWSFHQGDDETSFRCFREAAALREAAGELLRSAQSWHNLGYVLCRTGRAEDAFAAFREAERLLHRVRAEGPSDLREKAVRDGAFILSHTAYANARYRTAADAVGAATAYFTLVARTGVHREPLLARLALPVACPDPALARPLTDLTGLAPDPETWFRFVVAEGRHALATHRPGQGRRPYLGALLVALAEYGAWCVAQGRREEGLRLVGEAVSLARSCGWAGEAERITAAYGPR